MTSDALVGASIPIVTGFLLWVIKSFIHQEVGPKGDTGQRGQKGDDGEPSPVTVKDYKTICGMVAEDVTMRLNGRYMMRAETLEKFDELKVKLDNKETSVAVMQEQLRGLSSYVVNIDNSMQELRNYILKGSR